MPFTKLFFLVSRENRTEREREERRKIKRNIGKRKETKRETKNKRDESRVSICSIILNFKSAKLGYELMIMPSRRRKHHLLL